MYTYSYMYNSWLQLLYKNISCSLCSLVKCKKGVFHCVAALHCWYANT